MNSKMRGLALLLIGAVSASRSGQVDDNYGVIWIDGAVHVSGPEQVDDNGTIEVDYRVDSTQEHTFVKRLSRDAAPLEDPLESSDKIYKLQTGISRATSEQDCSKLALRLGSAYSYDPDMGEIRYMRMPNPSAINPIEFSGALIHYDCPESGF
ncbi:hypothetical protein HOC01_02695 [archaeon]|jgi:hypothetical protein|nr:hypothetical protein [archaeon]MBT6697771.1 hypothetical protein [archaeon]